MRDPFARIAEEMTAGRAGGKRAALALRRAWATASPPAPAAPRARRGPSGSRRGCGRATPGSHFRNLAVDGATSDEVLEQLPEAIELEPDLVTVVCGANDALRSTRPDAERYAGRLDAIFGRLRTREPGVRIVTATSPERLGLPGDRPAHARPGRARDRPRQRRHPRGAEAYGVPCLEVVGHPGSPSPRTSPPTACTRRRSATARGARVRGAESRALRDPDSIEGASERNRRMIDTEVGAS